MEGLGRARIALAQLPLRILLALPAEAKGLERQRARTPSLDAESSGPPKQEPLRRLENLRFTFAHSVKACGQKCAAGAAEWAPEHHEAEGRTLRR
jgi:hypothetical protein